MARKVRIYAKNIPLHVILKGADTVDIFHDESDYEAFKSILEELNSAHEIKIHAYSIMPQYFEFLATPKEVDTLARFIQALGRKYVGYYNKKYSHTGRIWKERYKTSLVQPSVYLLEIMKYIEQKAATNYKYSSIQKNLFDTPDCIVSQHAEYIQSATTNEQRSEKYAQFFKIEVEKKISSFLEDCLEKQKVTGSPEFIKKLEEKIGKTLLVQERGRPKKTVENNQVKNSVLRREESKGLKTDVTKKVLEAQTLPILFTTDENPSLVSLKIHDAKLEFNALVAESDESYNIIKVISDSGILEEKEMAVEDKNEKKVLLKGFRIVNKEKLNALSDAILADWVRKGIIDLINTHLRSLVNIEALNTAHQNQSQEQ